MPQLRTFSAYTKNANAGVSLITRKCALSDIDGNYITGAAGQYFQLHDKATAPVNADVPVKSFLLSSAGPINLMSIFQILGPINFTNGLAVAISSTEATLTLGTGSFDVFGEIEEYELPISGLSVAGDTTTAVSSLNVWLNVAGPQKVYRILTTAVGGGITANRYLMMFAVNGPSNGDRPIWVYPIANSNPAIDVSFGDNGFYSKEVRAGVLTQACVLYLSSTADTLTTTTDTFAIQVFYKNA